MVFKHKKIPEGYVIYFDGKKEDFKGYIYKISKLSSKKYSCLHKGWVVPNLDEIDIAFGLFDEYRANTDPIDPSSYDEMGKNMKLQPYPYQKEAIKFCIDNLKALLVLPCGSGRLNTLLCI